MHGTVTSAEASPAPGSSNLQPHRGALVLAYAAVATLWILFSDSAVGWLFDDTPAIVLASTLKGLFFVLVTSLLLYRLLRGRSDRATPVPDRKALGWPFLVLCLPVVGLSAVAIHQTIDRQEAKELARLQAIADLKVRQIAGWLAERASDAEFVHSSLFYAEQYERWQTRGDTASRTRLINRLEHLRQSRGFAAVTLLDPAGKRLWASASAPDEPVPCATAIAATNEATARCGPYRDAEARIFLDFSTRLGPPSGPTVVLHIDLGDWLQHELREWPGPSATSEALLFRNDDGRVRYLNELRHREGSALQTYVPKDDRDLINARVLHNKKSTAEFLRGEDYRDVLAIGVVRPVPGSDWRLLAKMDKAEVHEEVKGDVARIGLAGLLVVITIGALGILHRQREQLAWADASRASQEERLRALSLLSAIADGSADAIYAKDRQGRYIFFNRAAGRMVNKAPEEVLGQDDYAVFPRAQAERLTVMGREVLERGLPRDTVETIQTEDGERVFLATKAPLRDAAGRVVGLFGISRDITESRTAEEVLQASEQRFRDIVNASADWIWELDTQGRFIFVSDTIEPLLGYSPAAVLGKTPFDLMPEDEATRVRPVFAAIVRQRHTFRDMESIQLRQDGAVRYVQSTGMPITGSNGEWLGYRGLARDVTERRRAERDLRETSRRLRTLVNTIPDLIWLKSTQGVYLACNPRVESLFAAAEADILGKTDYDLVSSELADSFWASDKATIAAGSPTMCEDEIVFASDGHRELLQTIKTPFYDEQGEILGVFGIARDITAARAAEHELRQSNEELRRFNQAAVGRELDMIDLKRQVNALAQQLGKPPPFDLSFVELPVPNGAPHRT